MMPRKTLTAIGLLGALALPAVATAQPPSKADKRHAAKECKTEREAMGREAFREEYGTNRNQKNAFGKCVSGKAKEQLEEEPETDTPEEPAEGEPKNAAQTCAAEREAMGDEAFAETYGTNGNQRNAFGKCVSSKKDQPEG